MYKDSHLSDKTIKKCKEALTVYIKIMDTFGRREVLRLEQIHEGLSGEAAILVRVL